jgi:hypothetical protein
LSAEQSEPAADAPLPPRRHPFARQLAALAGLFVLLLATPTAAVKHSRRVPTKGDVMRALFTREQPPTLEELAHAVQQTPGLLELDSSGRDRGSERGTVQVTVGQPKGVLGGQRPTRRRRRRVRR